MKNWIKEKLYGERDCKIAELQNEVDDQAAGIRLLTKEKDLLNSKLIDARNTIERIERSIPPEDMTAVEELRLKMSIIDAPYLDVVVAMQPMFELSSPLDAPLDPVHDRRRIRLETCIGVDIIKPRDLEGESAGAFAHRTYYNIARTIGEKVTQQLLEQTGWRVGI